MEKFTTPLIQKVSEYVRELVSKKFPDNICYHNLDHILDVVKAAEIIGRKCNISDDDLEKIIIAAWFHDTGYYLGQEDHEKASAAIADDFLTNSGINPASIRQIKNCILATRVPQKPKNQLENILCDADLYHLATDDFMEKTDLLWREYAIQDPKLSYGNWLNVSRDFVSNHTYHTRFGKEYLQPALRKNLKLLDQRIKKLKK